MVLANACACPDGMYFDNVDTCLGCINDMCDTCNDGATCGKYNYLYFYNLYNIKSIL